MKAFCVLFLSITLIVAIGMQLEAAEVDRSDTFGNRLVAAQAYLNTVSMDEMTNSIIDESAKNLPENTREAYTKHLRLLIDVSVLKSAVLASMAKHFTVKELNALANFYGSPEGKSAMKKFGAYMADVMPIIQEEMNRAQKKLIEQIKKEKNEKKLE